MKNVLFPISIFCILSFFSSCFLNPDCKTGSGEIKSVMRKTAYFESIIIKGDCDVIVNHGDSISLTIMDYSNLTDLIETKVENKELIISSKKGTCVSNNKLGITITMPHLKKIVITGSGSVKANGNFREKIITADLSGSGDIILNLTDTTGFIIAEISGSGTIEAAACICDSAITEIKGSGDININAQKFLRAGIYGSGNITYKGSPKIETKISGSGEIINR